MLESEFQICPVFSNMFSELPHYPRNQLIRRGHHHSPKLPTSFQHFTITHPPVNRKTKIDVNGVDRYKYFQVPLKCNHSKTESALQQSSINEEEEELMKMKKYCTKQVQTKFRESSAQTTPWEPSFVISEGTDPELLKIDFLKWGSGLPVGLHEVELIERARMKRAWQQYLEQNHSNDLQKCSEILGAIERDEWQFRENEIQDVQNLRLALLEDMLNELHEKSAKNRKLKISKFAQLKEIEKQEKLKKLHKKTEQELRKIRLKELGIDGTCNKNRTLIEYEPQIIKFDVNKKKCQQIINDNSKLYQLEFSDIDNVNILPKWLDRATTIKDCCCLKLPGTHLCMRETKWTNPVLKELHQELENLRVKKQEKQFKRLTPSVQSSVSVLNTAEVEGIPDWEEGRFQSVITLQSIIKGRASQSLVYKGRERCQQLIEELKYNHCLLDERKQQIHNRRIEIRLNQRKERLEHEKLMKLQKNLRELQGNIVGTLLDFLNRKLQRLLDERRVHAVCKIFERQHKQNETDNQQEQRLENIIVEDMNLTSDEQIKDYIKSLLEQIEDDTFEILHKKATINQKNEMHIGSSSESHDNNEKQQLEKLKSIHGIVYNQNEGNE